VSWDVVQIEKLYWWIVEDPQPCSSSLSRLLRLWLLDDTRQPSSDNDGVTRVRSTSQEFPNNLLSVEEVSWMLYSRKSVFLYGWYGSGS
jgi:hypothetical protein